LPDGDARLVFPYLEGSLEERRQIGKFVFLFCFRTHRAAIPCEADLVVENQVGARDGVSVAHDFQAHLRLTAVQIGIDDEIDLQVEILVGRVRDFVCGKAMSFDDLFRRDRPNKALQRKYSHENGTRIRGIEIQ
jgi:hypothetical protein